MLFDLIGLKNLLADITDIEIKGNRFNNDNDIIIKLFGIDDRLPNSADYPDSDVICTRIESRIVERKKNNGDEKY